MKDTAEKPKFTKKTWIRLAVVIILIVLGASAIAYGVSQLLSASDGYRTIESTSNAADCADDFVFNYDLGVSGISPTVELKAVTTLYSELCVNCYRVFHPTELFEGYVNVATLNNNVNKEIEVPDELYNAFKTVLKYTERTLYLAPVYDNYDFLFSSSYDEDADDLDPSKNAELADEYANTLVYINSDGHIKLELLNNNRVKLSVSDEYLSYAEEIGIRSFIDFYYTKNAFIADIIADEMIEKGYIHGVISSKDGYIRNFDASDKEYALSIFNEKDGKVVYTGDLKYSCNASVCQLYGFIFGDSADMYYYRYNNGELVTRYISEKDGLPHNGAVSAVVFSEKQSCADLLLSVLPYYMYGDMSGYSFENTGCIYDTGGGNTTSKTAEGFQYVQ